MKKSFSEYLEFVNTTINPDIPVERQVVCASLSLFAAVGKLAALYELETLQSQALCVEYVLDVCNDALCSTAKLFCIANAGNTISEENFSIQIAWDILPEGKGFTAVNLTKMAHIANKNLQDVVGSGILQRTNFYPMFNAIAAIAGEYETTQAQLTYMDLNTPIILPDVLLGNY